MIKLIKDNNKTKCNSNSQLKKIFKNLLNSNYYHEITINYSNDYCFTFIDLQKINFKRMNIRPENILKLNFLIIVRKLKEFFTYINFDLKYESPGINDTIIKNKNATYKHDIYLIINYKDNYYDIAIEYFETIHDRIKDHEKRISSSVNLDSYHCYNEKNKNINEFMNNVLHDIIISICALTEDKYTLAKINYFKNYNENINLRRDTQLFNQIINWQKNNILCLETLFNDIDPQNLETNESFTFDEFINYFSEEYDINIKFEKNSYKCNYSYFIDIINYIDSNCSSRIIYYRKIYTKTLKLLLDSQEQIINYVKKKNESKKLIPKYLDNFLNLHIQNYKDKDTLVNTLKILNEKFNVK